jgi:hypothetical protein
MSICCFFLGENVLKIITSIPGFLDFRDVADESKETDEPMDVYEAEAEETDEPMEAAVRLGVMQFS